jgi:hypothetical protein
VDGDELRDRVRGLRLSRLTQPERRHPLLAGRDGPLGAEAEHFDLRIAGGDGELLARPAEDAEPAIGFLAQLDALLTLLVVPHDHGKTDLVAHGEDPRRIVVHEERLKGREVRAGETDRAVVRRRHGEE